MQKYFIFLLTLNLSSRYMTAQDLPKEEVKKIRNELKSYRKNPASYKQMIDRNTEYKDSADLMLTRKQITIEGLSGQVAEAHNKLTSLQSELKACQDKPVVVCPPPCPVPGAGPDTGIYYKVQLGVFKNPEISTILNESKYIGIEKADDKFRFVISYFNTKEEAEKVVAELKKLGVKGAFAAAYENGERVSDAQSHKISDTPKLRTSQKKKVPLREN